MYDLFIQTALMVSLGVIVYLVAEAMPRISDTEDTAKNNGNSVNGKRLGAILPLEQIDTKLNSLKDKTLRRLRVLIMKIDNFISRRLNNNKDNI